MASYRLDFRLPDDIPETLPVIPLRRGVLLPGAVIPLTLGRPRSIAASQAATGDLVLVAVQREPGPDVRPSGLLPWATFARVLERRDEGGVQIAIIQGLRRAQLTGFRSTDPYLEAQFQISRAVWPDDTEAEATILAIRSAVEETAELLGNNSPVGKRLLSFRDRRLFVDAVGASLDASETWKRELLQTLDPVVRARRVLEQLLQFKEVVSTQRSIKTKVEDQARNMQREMLLRQQLKAIQDELGEGASDEVGQLRERLDAKDLPEAVREVVDRELSRLDRLNPQSPERTVAIDWLGWVAELPWGTYTAGDVDLIALEAALDRSHHGLEDVKRQVIEHLAVRKLSGKGRADVLLLYGPPGVGKTSIGQAIADATGRDLVRVALGGVRDEAELRGHRRTYIGARPGRVIEGLRRAGSADPVVLLDEVDKLGRGWTGDPGSALLELLDPEQNHAFTDRYMEVPFDVSKALFIATANDLSTIPAPLRDRMEILEIAGYTREEKVVIARGHLLETLAENAGLEADDVELTDAAIAEAVRGWTREAGVRQLQRTLGKIYRAAAVKKAREELEAPMVVDADDLETYLGRRKFKDRKHEDPDRAGIATGLAWTPVGGSVLYVEASTLPGRGQLLLTGQLGDVMKESARAALTYVLSHGEDLGIPANAVENLDLHVHVPAGGVPKDGPSAGVTMFTALASLLSGRPVRGDVAMTGEATLRGRVLPVGGIKAKVLAAHRQGLKTIILPRANEDDLEDVPQSARDELTFVLVDRMSEVLEAALEPVHVPFPANDAPGVASRAAAG